MQPIPVLLLAALVLGSGTADADAWFDAGREALERARALQAERSDRAKNVILFVGDGMGVSTVTAARILEGQLRGEPGEENQLALMAEVAKE